MLKLEKKYGKEITNKNKQQDNKKITNEGSHQSVTLPHPLSAKPGGQKNLQEPLSNFAPLTQSWPRKGTLVGPKRVGGRHWGFSTAIVDLLREAWEKLRVYVEYKTRPGKWNRMDWKKILTRLGSKQGHSQEWSFDPFWVTLFALFTLFAIR